MDSDRRSMSADGKPVVLQGRAFDILEFLIAHRDRYVRRDEIEAHVWRGLSVAPNNLTVQMSSLRRALTDAGAGDVIITRPGIGYRFVGDISEIDPATDQPEVGTSNQSGAAAATQEAATTLEATAPSSARWGRWAAAAMVCVMVAAGAAAWTLYTAHPSPPRLSFAVLPFHNLSADRSQDYMADAVTDDLNDDLKHIPASTVIARESAEAVKSETPQQVGRNLNVRYELEGNLVPEDKQYHVTASLIDTATAATLWSNQFNIPRNNLSDVREDVVSHIASPLRVALDQVESTQSLHERPNNPDALDLFFRARSRMDWDHSRAGFVAAQQMLTQALAKQPSFPDAEAELGWLLLRKVTTLDDPDEDTDFAEAKKVIQEALAASPMNPKALADRAREYQVEGNCSAASQYADRVLAIEASSLEAHIVLAACAMADVRFEDAAEQYRQILRLDPDSPNNKPRYLSLGVVSLVLGRYSEAVGLLSRAQVDETGAADDMGPGEQARFMLIAAEELNGDHAKAEADYAEYTKKYPNRSAWRIGTYLPKKWLLLDGVKSLLKALQDAGMPQFNDEHMPGIAGADACNDSDFTATPTAITGGSVIYTSDIIQRLRDRGPLVVIDVSRGIARISSRTNVFDPTTGDTTLDFVQRTADKFAGKNRQTPIILVGDGPTGCTAYQAAQRLIAQGFMNVSWYRGGEEAWQRYQLEHGRPVALISK